ncbi:hypothetical protein [Haladaptatus salinisoli]|uniref:hypothetical protein n=1 Tax=Haladaptatus salinisoli TaxID=2884876 RepID=UPI001D09C7E1|nr:hypothetical protein [Haladaptatus salinisoli]
MSSTRRRFLLGGVSTVAPFSGCTRFGDGAATVAELEVEFVNGTNVRQMFHFAVEAAEGLGEWESRDVAPETRESVVREPPGGYDPVAIHGVVDDHPTSGELVGVGGGETGGVCLRVLFEYGMGAEPTFLQSSDTRC